LPCRLSILAFVAWLCLAAPRHYAATGLVLEVDADHRTVTISHAAIAGFMEAMAMPFRVRDAKLLAGLHAGDSVTFTLAVDKNSSWLESLHMVAFESSERDPSLAARLKLLDSVAGKPPASTIAIGQKAPDFTLSDQRDRPVTLSQFRGKVVALDFVYTRCPLPDYCFRLSSNFARLQKRFSGNPDLVLLTVTFDPVHDRPDVLAGYAKIWKADPAMWHFLTGEIADVDRLCDMFGVAHWRDDGLFTHSLHTVVIDREGKTAANIVGNKFTAQQLGDLVEATLRRR
jgi:protein SCO1